MTPFEDQASPPPRHHISWSPSKLFCYDGCAAQAKYKYLDKLPDPGGPALTRGLGMHKTSERYVKGEISELCAETRASKAYLDVFRKAYAEGRAFSELELAFKPDWTLCGWFDPYVWVRFKLDLVLVHEDSLVEVVDLKSGKLKTEEDGQYQQQLDMYKLALLEAARQNPEWLSVAGKAPRITSSLWFFDCQKPVPSAGGPVGEDARQALREKWEERVGRMLSDTIHAPTPSFKCRWCPFSKKSGGPCKF